jgi:glycosyltransferase involved in cell wall biosynthesis
MHETPALSDGSILPMQTPPRRNKGRIPTQSIHKLSIIIPCYNEASTVGILLDKVIDVSLISNIEKEIIIVNDASKDDTDQTIQLCLKDNPEVAITYIQHTINQGKGAAIHTGLKNATGDYILIQDADLEYDPKEYNTLLKPILDGHADIVYGSRFMGGHPHRILFFWHTLGNKWLTFINNIFTNLNLTDAHTCYKLLRASLLHQIPLLEKRFAFDAELNIKVSKIPCIRIYEVGISYYGRTVAEGKKIRLKDAFRTVFCLAKYSLTYKPNPNIATNKLKETVAPSLSHS